MTQLSTIAVLACVCAGVQAQGPHALTDADRQRIETIVHGMTLDQKLDYIGGTGFAVRALPELHLPAFEMSDGPVGVRSNSGLPSTTYAGGIGLAASWDRELASRVGAGIGRDARARGVHYMLGPGTNIYRSPRNGRNFEYFGEDPYLASEMVVGYIDGLQKQGVSATIKHYITNNSEFLRHDSNSVVDERSLREIYMPAFEAAVRRAHVAAIMDSYNLINGQHATQNGYLNTEVARKEWGFQGVVMSDWSATYDAVAAANGGLDLEMPTGKFMNRANLAEAVKSGKVPEAIIDDKVRHILAPALMFGWLDREQRDPSISLMDKEDNAAALDSARESVVLLKNEGSLLPLDKTRVKTILVVGPNAYPGTAVGGGSAGVVPFHNVSLLEGMGAVAPGVTVLYEAGLPTLSELAGRTSFMTEAEGGKPGVTLEIFESKGFEGEPRNLVVQHISNEGLGRNLPESVRSLLNTGQASGGGRNTAQRYTGYYRAEKDADYLVALAGGGENSGNRVYVDGKVLIDDWTLVKATEPHLTMHLSAGMHKVVAESWGGGVPGSRLHLAIAPVASLISERVKLAAAHADVVVVAAGFYSTPEMSTEGEGGDRTFALPYGQDELIRVMAEANPRTIVTVTSGGNVDSTAWIDRVPGLLEQWYGGQEGGRAMAEILFGDVDPSGHLPVTFERRAEDNPSFASYYPADGSIDVVYKDGIFVGYRGYEKNKVQPLFPFGFGLTYTSFRYSNLKVSGPKGSAMATAEFDVTNTGKRAGAAVAQLYVEDGHAPVERPIHELKGFERVQLTPGQTRHVSIPLTARAFAYYDVAGKRWVIAPGSFTLQVGDSSASLPLHAAVSITSSDAAGAKF